MGYYTAYTLTARCADGDRPTAEIFEQLKQKCKDLDIIGYALDSGWAEEYEIFFDAHGSVKWYDHDEDMLAISKAFPDMVFQLHGNGEEEGDLWATYYQNGRMEHCPVSFAYPEPKTIVWKK